MLQVQPLQVLNKRDKMKKVKVYSTSTCYFCVKLKEFLHQHKIPFENFDINEDKKAAMEMIKKTNQTGVPVVEIGKEIIIGFDQDRIKKALKIK